MSFLRFFFSSALLTVFFIFIFSYLLYALAWSVLATLVRFWFSVFIFFSSSSIFFWHGLSLSLSSRFLCSSFPTDRYRVVCWEQRESFHLSCIQTWGTRHYQTGRPKNTSTVLVNRLATTNLLYTYDRLINLLFSRTTTLSSLFHYSSPSYSICVFILFHRQKQLHLLLIISVSV